MRASLQAEYGIRLIPGGRTEPYRSPFEVADLVEHLPAGCAYGRALGGEAAVSNEGLLLRELEFVTRMVAWANGGGKGKEPERIPLPVAAGAERAQAAAVSAKARRWQERQERRAQA